MKKIVVTIMVLSMVFAAIAAMAQGEKNFTITPRIAANFAVGKDSLDNKVGHQFGILADMNWASFPVGLEIGYLGSSKSNGHSGSFIDEDLDTGDEVTVNWNADVKVKVGSMPVLATYAFNFNDNFYAKIGAGFAVKRTKLQADNVNFDWGSYSFTDLYADEAQTKTHFAWKLGLGYKFAQNWSTELFYYSDGNTNFDGGRVENYDYKGNYIQFNVGYSF